MKGDSKTSKVAQVLDYIRSPEGRRSVRSLMFGNGYPYQRALAVIVLQKTDAQKDREIEAIVDEVMLADLAVEAVSA